MSPRDEPAGRPQDLHDLIQEVYSELRAMAGAYLRGERAGHTLQPTALANEVYIKFAGSDRTLFESKPQLMAAAAQAMRRILIDHARARGCEKRGGRFRRLNVEEVRVGRNDPGVAIVDFDDAVTELERLQPRVGRIVELRVFGQLSIAQVADVVGVAESTVSEDWATAKAWLKHRFMKTGARADAAPRTAAA